MAELFLLNIIIDFIQNKEINKNYIIEKLLLILKSDYLEIFSNEHIKFLNIIVKKILIYQINYSLKSMQLNS